MPTGRGPTWPRCRIWRSASSRRRTSVRVRRASPATGHGQARPRAEYDPDGLFNSWMGRTFASDLYLPQRRRAGSRPAKFFKPEMAPLPQHVAVALQHGPQAGMALSPSTTPRLSLAISASRTATDFPATAAQVTVRTDMPRGHSGDVGMVLAGTVATPAATAVAPAGPSIGVVEDGDSAGRSGRSATSAAGR